MPTAYGAGNFITQAYEAFADDVRERTGGEIDITVHPGGSLYGGSEILRAVREGQVPIGARFLGAHSNEEPLFGIDTIPFLATNAEEARALYDASRPALEAALEERGLKLLFAPIWPPQGLYTTEPVATIEDMKGRRFRAYDPNTTRLAELMGAVPTRTEAAEIAQAFSTGMADSMMASSAIGVSQKIWDFADHFYRVNAWLPKSVVVVNLDTWNALDETTRAALTEAAQEAEASVWAEMETVDQGYLDTFRENGLAVEEPSPALQEAFRAIGDTMIAEWVESAGDEAGAVIDAYRAR